MLMRLALRALSLGAKFALTLAIARELGYAAMAQYGMAVAAAVIGTKMLGLGFSAECNRRLASIPVAALGDIGRLAGVHAACYGLLAAGGTLLWRYGGVAPPDYFTAPIAVVIAVLVMVEHQAFEVSGYLFALHQTRAASWLMFARNGLWALLAIAGLASGVIGSMLAVLMLWICGDVLVIAIGWYLILGLRGRSSAPVQPRRLPEARPAGRLLDVWRAGAAIYLAAILLAGLQYAERFLGAALLPAEELGRYVFLWAIANAVQTLAHAAIATTAGPALARAAHQGGSGVRKLLGRQLAWTLAATLTMAGALWLACDAILMMAGKAASQDDGLIFGILLVSFVLRSVADIAWAAAIALELRGITLLGMTLVALAGVPLAWMAVHTAGVTGAALAHGIVSLAVAGWLGVTLYRRLAGIGLARPAAADRGVP